MAVTAVVEAGWIVGMREMIGWFGKIVVPVPEGAAIACNSGRDEALVKLLTLQINSH